MRKKRGAGSVPFGYDIDENNSDYVIPNEEHLKVFQNEFELALRFLGNELIAIKMAATNFSGKLIVWSILLLIMSFFILEVFGVAEMFGYGMEE